MVATDVTSPADSYGGSKERGADWWLMHLGILGGLLIIINIPIAMLVTSPLIGSFAWELAMVLRILCRILLGIGFLGLYLKNKVIVSLLAGIFYIVMGILYIVVFVIPLFAGLAISPYVAYNIMGFIASIFVALTFFISSRRSVNPRFYVSAGILLFSWGCLVFSSFWLFEWLGILAPWSLSTMSAIIHSFAIMGALLLIIAFLVENQTISPIIGKRFSGVMSVILGVALLTMAAFSWIAYIPIFGDFWVGEALGAVMIIKGILNLRADLGEEA